jgi:hypothetical protein
MRDGRGTFNGCMSSTVWNGMQETLDVNAAMWAELWSKA